MSQALVNPASSEAKKLEISISRHFTFWLVEQSLSLAFTTYQVGKLFLLGVKPDGKLSIFERNFERCMGLCTHGNSLYMATLYQIWKLENALGPGEAYQHHDRLYVPRFCAVTGDVDAHDVVVDRQGSVLFVNTLFSCVAQISETHSFKPLWKPPFISKLAAEDRCHLNGLALREGLPRYVTMVSRSDASDGWRDHRTDGGMVMDMVTDGEIAHGLSMPHSPRWHQERLWLHDSGSGYFGYIDMDRQRFEPVTFCPGYLRGLAFHGDYAIVGLSRPRQNKTFTGLALDENLGKKNIEARCGLQVIDLRSGDAVHWLRIDGVVEEIYDVVALPGVKAPSAIGFKGDEIKRMIAIESGIKE